MAKKLLIGLFSFLTLILFVACGTYKVKGIQIVYYIPQGELSPSYFETVPEEGVRLERPVAQQVNAEGKVTTWGYRLHAPAKILGWYYDIAYTKEVNFKTDYFKVSTALYAKIEIAKIKINFAPFAPGVTINGTLPTEYDFEHGTNLPEAKRTGHEFKGWSTVDPNSPKFDPVNSIINSLQEKSYFDDITLWPYFQAVEYRITLEVDGKKYQVTAFYGKVIQKILELTAELEAKYGVGKVNWYHYSPRFMFDPRLKYEHDKPFKGTYFLLNGELKESTSTSGTIVAKIDK